MVALPRHQLIHGQFRRLETVWGRWLAPHGLPEPRLRAPGRCGEVGCNGTGDEADQSGSTGTAPKCRLLKNQGSVLAGEKNGAAPWEA